MKTIINNRRNGVCFSRFYNSQFSLLAVGAIFSCLPAEAQTEKWDASLPDPNAPWSGAEKKAQPKPAGAERTTTTTTAPVPQNQPKSAAPDSLAAAPPMLQSPKPTKHQISFSGDYFLGQGDVTLPLAFSLGNTAQPEVAKPERDAGYFGGTLSYSYGQSWYLDLGYSAGESSGNVNVKLGGGVPTAFTVEDTAYQAYVRFVPSSLRGKRLSAYVRLGGSFVDSQITDEATIPLVGFYQEKIDSADLLGNIGFGLGYRLFNVGRFRLGLQAEFEGFYGIRTQDIVESVNGNPIPGVSIDNTLYGGIGRGTVRMEYRFGRSGLLRMFVDAGVQGKFSIIDYPSAPNFPGDTFDELLWGPYAKLGFSYSF